MMNFRRGPRVEPRDRNGRPPAWFSPRLRFTSARLIAYFSRSPVQIALVVSLAALLAPIWLTPYPPLTDYPNHLSRIHILEHLNDDPLFQEKFNRLSILFPNMAMEMVMPLFAGTVGVEIAGKLFLTLAVLMFALGCGLISTALRGTLTWSAVLSTFLIYNSNFFMGFANYIFGLGLYSAVFGWRLTWEDRVTPRRAIALFPLAFFCYACHLTSFVFLAFSLGVHWIYKVYRRDGFNIKRAAWVFPALAPPVAAHLLLDRHAGDSGMVAWGAVSTKVVTFFGWLITYDYALDALFAAWLVAAVLLATRGGGVRFDGLACSLAAAFWLAFILSPEVLLGSWAADARLVVPSMVFSIFAIRPKPPKRLASALLTITLVALLGRVALVGRAWSQGSELIAEQIEIFELIEARSTVYPMYWLSGDRQTDKRERGIEHAASYAAIERGAFVPNTFAIDGQHVLVFRNQSDQLSHKAVRYFTAEDWERLFTETAIDYAWTWRAPDGARKQVEAWCDLVVARGQGRLYRARRVSAAGRSADLHGRQRASSPRLSR